jgi:hypothetical protein
MKRFLSWALALSLFAGATLGASAADRSKERAAPATTAAADEAIALLPPSNLIAVVDATRIFNEVLPKLKASSPDGLAKFFKELEEFTTKTGIDPTRIKSAVIGVKMEGQQGTGAAILQGIDLDPKRIEAAVKEEQGEFKTIDYKGRPIFVVTLKSKPQPASDSSVNSPFPSLNELAFAQLGAPGVAIGDLNGIKGVLDVQAGAVNKEANAMLSQALKETSASGLIRFAASLPENLRQDLGSQGDLFKQIAAIKMISGSFDLASDFSASLDARLRTGSEDDARQLKTSLEGLLFLGRSFLGGNSDPMMQALNQLLDQIRIVAQASDVSLSLTLPRAIIDLLTKSQKKEEAAKPATSKP